MSIQQLSFFFFMTTFFQVVNGMTDHLEDPSMGMQKIFLFIKKEK